MTKVKQYRVKHDFALPIRTKLPNKHWFEDSIRLCEGALIIYRGSNKECYMSCEYLGSHTLPLHEIQQYYMDNFNNNEPIRNFNNKLFNQLLDDGVIELDNSDMV